LQRAQTKISLRKRRGCTMARVKGDEIYRAARLTQTTGTRADEKGKEVSPAERNAKIRVPNRIMKIIIRADYGMAHAHGICARSSRGRQSHRAHLSGFSCHARVIRSRSLTQLRRLDSACLPTTTTTKFPSRWRCELDKASIVSPGDHLHRASSCSTSRPSVT